MPDRGRPMKIRTIVVDDEPLARSNITTLLRRDPDIELVSECGSGADAVAAIRTLKPHLVFLDVQMPECDGFDVLELLGADLPPAVVFVTAYDEYALKAFDAGALDYLLKPFDNARFERTVDRLKVRLSHRQERPARVERLAIKSAGRVAFIRIGDIDWIEAADYYASLHVGPRTYLLRRSLSDLEQELDPTTFCRVHRSSIVNLGRVQGLTLKEDGEHDVLLDNGTAIRLSRRYRKRLNTRLGITDRRA